MSLTDLPLSFWDYAFETNTFTLNRALYNSVDMTPYEQWFGKKPKLSFLKVWGCDQGWSWSKSYPDALLKHGVKNLQPDKLEPKAEKCTGEASSPKPL